MSFEPLTAPGKLLLFARQRRALAQLDPQIALAPRRSQWPGALKPHAPYWAPGGTPHKLRRNRIPTHAMTYSERAATGRTVTGVRP